MGWWLRAGKPVHLVDPNSLQACNEQHPKSYNGKFLHGMEKSTWFAVQKCLNINEPMNLPVEIWNEV